MNCGDTYLRKKVIHFNEIPSVTNQKTINALICVDLTETKIKFMLQTLTQCWSLEHHEISILRRSENLTCLPNRVVVPVAFFSVAWGGGCGTGVDVSDRNLRTSRSLAWYGWGPQQPVPLALRCESSWCGDWRLGRVPHMAGLTMINDDLGVLTRLKMCNTDFRSLKTKSGLRPCLVPLTRRSCWKCYRMFRTKLEVLMRLLLLTRNSGKDERFTKN